MAFDTTKPAYRDALILQRSAMDMVKDEEVKPVVKAQLMRAYCELEKLKRVMRGLAANTSQSIRSEPVKKYKQPQAAPMEYIEPEPMRVGPTVHPTDTQPEGTTDARGTAKPE